MERRIATGLKPNVGSVASVSSAGGTLPWRPTTVRVTSRALYMIFRHHVVDFHGKFQTCWSAPDYWIEYDAPSSAAGPSH